MSCSFSQVQYSCTTYVGVPLTIADRVVKARRPKLEVKILTFASVSASRPKFLGFGPSAVSKEKVDYIGYAKG